MKITQKITALTTSAVMLWSTTVPAFAAVHGVAVNDNNAAGSVNETYVEVVQDNTIVQNNNMDVKNNIKLNTNTGGNTADKNNGMGRVVTGDSRTDVSLSTVGNENIAESSPCGSCDSEITAGNVKNAADTWNASEITYEKANSLFQNNTARVDNDVRIDSNTGNNTADKNNDEGRVITGDTFAPVSISNDVNHNMGALSAGRTTLGTGTRLKTLNDNNAADSVNYATINALTSNVLTQDNVANIDNDVKLDLNTGYNTANRNNGLGRIDTGFAVADVMLDNSANHNFAVLDGCCGIQWEADNVKNAADSENTSVATLHSTMQAFQSNCGDDYMSYSRGGYGHNCGVENEVSGYMDTGYNSTDSNNDDDVYTGIVDANVEVETATNENVFGNMNLPTGATTSANNSLGWWMFWMNL